MAIELGNEVQDMITGFRGIAISRYDHLFAVSEIKIQPKALNEHGLPMDAVWFEEGRLEVCTGPKPVC